MKSTAAVATALVVAVTHGAIAAELKVLSSNGTGAMVQEIGNRFAKTSGDTLSYRIDVAVRIQKAIEGGEAFDAAFLTTAVTEDLVKQSKITPATAREVARSGIGISIRAGATKPDISTTDAFRRAMLAAKSVVYTPAGGSGIYFLKVLDRLGITDEMKPKLVAYVSGTVGDRVASGEIEYAVQQISELLPVEGIELVGPFPPELQLITLFSAGMSPHAKNPDAARALLRFFAEPAALAVIKAKGMNPP
jgi:molybdate transport system substrate-binding protein